MQKYTDKIPPRAPAVVSQSTGAPTRAPQSQLAAQQTEPQATAAQQQRVQQPKQSQPTMIPATEFWAQVWEEHGPTSSPRHTDVRHFRWVNTQSDKPSLKASSRHYHNWNAPRSM